MVAAITSVDLSGGAEFTLPPDPTPGRSIVFEGEFASLPATIRPAAGQTIENRPEKLILDINRAAILRWSGRTWQIFTRVP